LERSGYGLIGVLSRYFPSETEETHKKKNRITAVPAEIPTQSHPNKSPKKYH
jgi:hypothetical protein